MAISNVSTTNTPAANTVSPTSVADSESRNLRNQIANAQQRLNKLSSDSEISQEEKAKERQEIQKQIAELNRKLRQRRIEQKEEAAEATEKQEKQKQLQNIEQEKEEAKPQEEDKSNTSAVHMQNMLTADSKLRQQQIQESTSRATEGLEGILEAEIKSDTLYGSDTTAKEEKLSDMQKNIPINIEEFPQPGASIPFATDINTKIIIRDK